ncbi:type II toxin-antitoxin system prevent-host-death family antitoxin [Rhizobium sp. TH135]|jgi:prevent-host-death family protein|uniref:type II toxin-antitoxin system Phd/YefM family antitoxin n=1 Tax=Rhizobium sp. TH135 TaxID=2067451 RepID=UPI000C7E7F54|nr:type II toxin-antitoxin system prevent-host-death family antitoxin [Rhizobium sp. TH135]PLK72759.1 type II toxin-antitoxin system prevent-host-death family antitoxin [Rhizobium sp. TH135]
MRVSMEQAAARVEELVERAERGEPVIITRDGQDAVVLRPVEASERRPTLSQEERRQLFKQLQQRVAEIPDPFPDETAARSQDFLYDENGLPK